MAVQLSCGLVGRLDVADVHVQVHHDDSLHKELHFSPATEQIQAMDTLHIIQIDLHVVLGSILGHGAVEVNHFPFDGCIVLKEVPVEVRFFYNRFG